MGNIFHKEDVRRNSEDMNIPPENGYILSGYYLPEEILVQILSYVDEKTLAFSCRRVCKYWQIVVEELALKYKAEKENCLHFRDASHVLHKIKWFDYYALLRKKPFGKNLLKNNCGQDKFSHWTMLSSGGDGWKVERTPAGTEKLPPEIDGNPSPDFNGRTSCFVTSYNSCSKEQLIALEPLGLTPNIMDHMQLRIEISEWVACRFDCGSVYDLKVSLLKENLEPKISFEIRENFSVHPREIWKKISHTFQDYGPGVRFIKFYHGGMDSQFWAGHYGSKMSGGVVKVLPYIVKSLSKLSSSSVSSDLDEK